MPIPQYFMFYYRLNQLSGSQFPVLRPQPIALWALIAVLLCAPLPGQEIKAVPAKEINTEIEAVAAQETDAETQSAKAFDPTTVKGDLQKIKKPLSSLIKLTTKGGRLAPVYEKERQAAYALITQINSIGGNRGGGSSSSGTNWEIRINNNGFEGFANYGYSRVYPNPSPNSWKIKLKELKAPHRDLYIEANPKGVVSITMNGGDDPYLLRIRQQPSGSLFVQEVSDTAIFSEISPSFDVFCRQHSQFTQDRLLPMIRHLGIDAPMTQFDKNVQASVIAFLAPIKDEELNRFRSLFKNLDSSDYAARETDSKKLSEVFPDWQNFVMRGVVSDHFSIEMRFRLMKALEKNGKPEQVKASRFAISADLANKPEYLIWLLDIQKDQSVRTDLFRQLERSTGLNLGEDVASWKSKFVNNSSNTTSINPSPPINLLAEKGPLDTAVTYVGQLVKLKSKGDTIQLDRDFWSEQFGNKSIQQLVRDTNESLKKLNMPANYDPDPLFELASVGHPQAIFAKLRSDLQKKTKNSSVYYYSYNRTSSSSLNRTFANKDLTASMNFEPTTNVTRKVVQGGTNVKPPKLDSKPFKFELSELQAGRRKILVHAQTDGRLRVALMTEKSNSVVQILQQPDGKFVVQDVRGSEIFTAKGKNFSDFHEKHRDYCQKKLFPLFNHFGIRFSDDLFVAKDKPKTPASSPPSVEEKKTPQPVLRGRPTIRAPKSIP
nr:hypothetical protein [Mariniblastus sp.]